LQAGCKLGKTCARERRAPVVTVNRPSLLYLYRRAKEVAHNAKELALSKLLHP
jgi:hypothetical protein